MRLACAQCNLSGLRMIPLSSSPSWLSGSGGMDGGRIRQRSGRRTSGDPGAGAVLVETRRDRRTRRSAARAVDRGASGRWPQPTWRVPTLCSFVLFCPPPAEPFVRFDEGSCWSVRLGRVR